VFFRDSINKKDKKDFLDEKVLKDPRWPQRVALRYQDLQKQDPGGGSPFSDLDRLKQAIHVVSKEMMGEAKSPGTNLGSSATQQLDIDDKIGWVMRAIRAIEGGHRGTLLKCIKALPEIGRLVNPYDPEIKSSGGFFALRDWAVQLHRELLLVEMRDLQQEEGSNDGGEHQVRRNKIQVILGRLKPGKCNGIAAIQGRDGVIVSEPEDVIRVLRDYWREVFSSSSCDEETLSRWIAEEEHLPDWGIADSAWIPDKEDMSKTIKHTGKSAPGPDGIPYLAWRLLGDLARDVLFRAAIDMSDNDIGGSLEEISFGKEMGVEGFNLGNMIFLPKKPSGHHPLFGDFYTPGDVRPLMVVNTDNRILANFFRRQWEPLLDRWISPSQQGFLPGRSMASNIVGVEAAAQAASLKDRRGGILLLDFKAAFPSISQGFLLKMLDHLKLPRGVRRVVRNLYYNHECRVCFGGVVGEGFKVGAGIRQGCPLSPLLFALAIDILLRRIIKLVPGVKVYAFADDIALVLENVGRDMGLLTQIFQDLEKVAGLSLNRKKCVLIPLWPTNTSIVKSELIRRLPEWGDIQVSFASVYLGVNIGPESAKGFWDVAVKKYKDRARDWGKTGLGLYFASVAYSVYVLPILSFLAQFKIPSKEVYQAEEEALRSMIPGPYRWCSKNDTFVLATHYGQARDFTSLEHLSIAARTRLLLCENVKHGGLRIPERCREIDEACCNSSQSLYRQRLWKDWYGGGVVQDIREGRDQLVQRGFSLDALWKKAAGPYDPEEDSRVRDKKARRALQKTIRSELHKTLTVDPVSRMRFRLDRWNLDGLPGETSTRFLRFIEVVKHHLPPRIVAAVLRTAWNGWCTSRRFQHSGKCIFACQAFAQEDSIEHYAGCSICVNFLRGKLHYRGPINRGHLIVLGANSGSQTDEDICRLALWNYSIYKTFNSLRCNHGGSRSATAMIELLNGCLREGVGNDETGIRLIDQGWRHEFRLRVEDESDSDLFTWDLD